MTVAESSDYKATSKHAEVVEYCERLAKLSPLVRVAELGVTKEGRKLPLVILADPPIATPEEAARSGKLVVFAMGNIHAGEVDGKEALLMLMRDLALAKDRPLLKDLVLLFVPNFNADGGDRIDKNRPWQNGPDDVGIRANAQGFDLNRDYIKLESPEVRALVQLLHPLGSRHLHRHAHHQRLLPQSHHHLRWAAPSRLRSEAGRIHAGIRCCPKWARC